MARAVAWVVYPDRVEKVEIVKKGASERQLVRPIKNPITVEDENGNRYPIPADQLYNDPISASVRQAEYAQQFNLRANPLEDDDDDPDDDDPDDDDPDDPDDDDPDDPDDDDPDDPDDDDPDDPDDDDPDDDDSD